MTDLESDVWSWRNPASSSVGTRKAPGKTNSKQQSYSMNIHRVGTYLMPSRSRRQAEHCPIDRIGIGCLAIEESGIESKRARKLNSINTHRVGTYLIPLCSCCRAEQPPVDRIGIRPLVVEETRYECWDRQAPSPQAGPCKHHGQRIHCSNLINISKMY